MNFVLYCFLSDLGLYIIVHLPAYCFWVNDKKFRNLYHTIKTDGGLNVLKQTEDIIYKGRFFWKLLGIIIQIILYLEDFIFLLDFGLLSIIKEQLSFWLLFVILHGISLLLNIQGKYLLLSFII